MGGWREEEMLGRRRPHSGTSPSDPFILGIGRAEKRGKQTKE